MIANSLFLSSYYHPDAATIKATIVDSVTLLLEIALTRKGGIGIICLKLKTLASVSIAVGKFKTSSSDLTSQRLDLEG